jgi:ATP adenylyltransferase
MDHLWAPWRMEYITDPNRKKPTEAERPECFLCRVPKEKCDRENLLVARADGCSAILNRFPYNNGHLLVSPTRHVANLDELTDAELLACQKLLQRGIQAIRETMQPQGFNVGLNLGAVAGAGCPGHLHWHLVPRWAGDVNFMTISGDARVIVQSLDAAWTLLRDRMEPR